MAQHKVLAPQQSAETVTKVTAHLFYTNRPTINVLNFNSMKSTFIKIEGITLLKYRFSQIEIKVEKFIVLSISKYFRTLYTQPSNIESLSWVSTLEWGNALFKRHVSSQRANISGHCTRNHAVLNCSAGYQPSSWEVLCWRSMWQCTGRGFQEIVLITQQYRTVQLSINPWVGKSF